MPKRTEVVINTGSEKVVVMWDGYQQEFEPGESRGYEEEIALAVIAEDREGNLKLESDVEEEVVVEEPVVEKKPAPKKKSSKK